MAEKSDWENFKEAVSDFVGSITGRSSSNRKDGQETRGGSTGYSDNAPTRSLRPKMRPGSTSTGNSSNGGDDSGKSAAERADAASFLAKSRIAQRNPEIVQPKNLNYDNVPYYSGPNIRPKNMVFNPATLDSPAMYLPNTKTPGTLENLMRLRSEMPRAMATDLRLGLGSLGGIEGFTDALEGMGYGRLRDPETGEPSAEATQAFNNFKDASDNPADNPADLGGGQGDSDGCPPGYEMDYVTNMCVPSQRTAAVPMANTGLMGPQTAAPAPAMTPFPETNPLTSGTYTPFTPLQYTQPLAYTAPTIEPEGIAGIPTTPIFPYR